MKIILYIILIAIGTYLALFLATTFVSVLSNYLLKHKTLRAIKDNYRNSLKNGKSSVLSIENIFEKITKIGIEARELSASLRDLDKEMITLAREAYFWDDGIDHLNRKNMWMARRFTISQRQITLWHSGVRELLKDYSDEGFYKIFGKTKQKALEVEQMILRIEYLYGKVMNYCHRFVGLEYQKELLDSYSGIAMSFLYELEFLNDLIDPYLYVFMKVRHPSIRKDGEIEFTFDAFKKHIKVSTSDHLSRTFIDLKGLNRYLQKP